MSEDVVVGDLLTRLVWTVKAYSDFRSHRALVKAIELQCLYLMRPHCRMLDTMGQKLCENVYALGLPGAFENQMLANIIVARGRGTAEREELLGGALDILEYCEATPEKKERLIAEAVIAGEEKDG